MGFHGSGMKSSIAERVKRQDFHYDIIYSDGVALPLRFPMEWLVPRVREDIKASVEDARTMKRTERVIVPLSLLPFSTIHARFLRSPLSIIREY